MNFVRKLVLSVLALLIPATGIALLQVRSSKIAATPSDPAIELQEKIDSGKVRLEFEPDYGYLRSLLKNLKIPISSQTLVFSKSSFELGLISPSNPRALYFNDDSYVSWIPYSSIMEIASVDPKAGAVFYTLSQEQASRPRFERKTEECLVCHDTFQAAAPVPRLLMLSVLPNPAGNAIKAAALITNDESPLRERWGGWYVTGTHGSQRHLGNTIVKASESDIENIKSYIGKMDLSTGANVTDLSRWFDTKPYLSPHSDIVALMILGHQTHVHNLINFARHALQSALQEKQDSKAALDFVKDDFEKIVRAMLFAGEAPLTEAITGTSGFASDFVKLGPRDSRGRSLRDLDLKHRLFRYPMSYVIYSRTFDEMPAPIKDYVARRVGEVLNGEDKSEDFAHLSKPDCEAILGILRETKPGFLH
ncbi:MAG: hypothetical protein DMG13_01925 [Acidobacteria bacterium]|nr:MAG: hypothetical protein DMG13_01925 [Acidobacteriota bacterium]